MQKKVQNYCDAFESQGPRKKRAKNRQRDRSRELKPLRPCQSINTVVQRSACNSGESEHHLYGWVSRGHWSNQVGGSWLSELVFQCRAAGWHSDEENDVLVSHRITQQTHGHRAGAGKLGHGAPPRMHPFGHKQSKRPGL